MTRRVRIRIAIMLLTGCFAAGCSADAPELATPTEPAEPATAAAIFGTEDTVCQSVRLFNEDDDQAKANNATDCLLAEVQAGRPVTVDIAATTAEGDPIYMRYAFDGETTLIVEDDRADTFGSGSVRAIRCNNVQRSAWFPEGIDCQGADHPGFREAVG